MSPSIFPTSSHPSPSTLQQLLQEKTSKEKKRHHTVIHRLSKVQTARNPNETPVERRSFCCMPPPLPDSASISSSHLLPGGKRRKKKRANKKFHTKNKSKRNRPTSKEKESCYHGTLFFLDRRSSLVKKTKSKTVTIVTCCTAPHSGR